LFIYFELRLGGVRNNITAAVFEYFVSNREYCSGGGGGGGGVGGDAR